MLPSLVAVVVAVLVAKLAEDGRSSLLAHESAPGNTSNLSIIRSSHSSSSRLLVNVQGLVRLHLGRRRACQCAGRRLAHLARRGARREQADAIDAVVRLAGLDARREVVAEVAAALGADDLGAARRADRAVDCARKILVVRKKRAKDKSEKNPRKAARCERPQTVAEKEASGAPLLVLPWNAGQPSPCGWYFALA